MPDDRRYDGTAERFFPKGDFSAAGPQQTGSDSWYDTPPPDEQLDAPPPGEWHHSPASSGRPERPAEPERGAEPGVDQGPGDSGPQRAAQGPPEAVAGVADAAAGPELARAVLDAALARRRAAAQANPRRRSGGGTGKRPRGYSGPGPDPRDPQLFGDVLGRLMKARGWEKPKAEATVFGAWERVVGPDIAKHSRPVKLDDGVLTVEAESTAWATQLRMLAAKLLRNIAGEVGHNVVTKLNIHGPAAPSWNRGPRRVQGRGPRDTYG